MAEQRLCVYCQKELPPRRRKYCSDACAYHYKASFRVGKLKGYGAREFRLKRASFRQIRRILRRGY